MSSRRIAHGVAAAVAAATFLLGGSGALAAAAPAVSVDPAGALDHGQTVTVTATGFPAGQTVYFAECGLADGQPACDGAQAKEATADANGTATAPMTVHKSFTGVDLNTGAVVGQVDCGAGPACQVTAVNRSAEPVFAYAGIVFK